MRCERYIMEVAFSRRSFDQELSHDDSETADVAAIDVHVYVKPGLSALTITAVMNVVLPGRLVALLLRQHANHTVSYAAVSCWDSPQVVRVGSKARTNRGSEIIIRV